MSGSMLGSMPEVVQRAEIPFLIMFSVYVWLLFWVSVWLHETHEDSENEKNNIQSSNLHELQIRITSLTT